MSIMIVLMKYFFKLKYCVYLFLTALGRVLPYWPVMLPCCQGNFSQILAKQLTHILIWYLNLCIYIYIYMYTVRDESIEWSDYQSNIMCVSRLQPVVVTQLSHTSTRSQTEDIAYKEMEEFWEKNRRLNRPLSPHLRIYK